MKHLIMSIFVSLSASMAAAAPLTGTFPSIDGGTLSIEDWRGQPVLVVNTASLCGFTPQYDDLQTLHETYGPKGLVVLAVPSDDFRQELSSDEDVKDFCEINFGLTLPMTTITDVRGPDAHAFYRQLEESAGFVPAWNFDKVLIGPDGALVATWRSITRPTAPVVIESIERLLQE